MSKDTAASEALVKPFVEARTDIERAIGKCESATTRNFLERMLVGVNRRIASLQAEAPSLDEGADLPGIRTHKLRMKSAAHYSNPVLD